MITSGVATPTYASKSIITVIATAATSPATKPVESALVLLIVRAIMLCRRACAKRLDGSVRRSLGEATTTLRRQSAPASR